MIVNVLFLFIKRYLMIQVGNHVLVYMSQFWYSDIWIYVVSLYVLMNFRCEFMCFEKI